MSPNRKATPFKKNPVSVLRFRPRPEASEPEPEAGFGHWVRLRSLSPPQVQPPRPPLPPLQALGSYTRPRNTTRPVQSRSLRQKSRRKNRRLTLPDRAWASRLGGAAIVGSRRPLSGEPVHLEPRRFATLVESGSSRVGSYPNIDPRVVPLFRASCTRITTVKCLRCGVRRRPWLDPSPVMVLRLCPVFEGLKLEKRKKKL